MKQGDLGGFVLALTVFLGIGPGAAAFGAQSGGTTAPGQPAPGPRKEGAEMYRGYCAPCHGETGAGDGPAAPALTSRPTDLSRLSARNGGRFPADRVSTVLEFGVSIPAHGSVDMPTWGSTFRVMGDQQAVRERIRALSRYLESIQVK
jgi:mono/diheme cytochrome c family protein